MTPKNAGLILATEIRAGRRVPGFKIINPRHVREVKPWCFHGISSNPDDAPQTRVHYAGYHVDLDTPYAAFVDALLGCGCPLIDLRFNANEGDQEPASTAQCDTAQHNAKVLL